VVWTAADKRLREEGHSPVKETALRAGPPRNRARQQAPVVFCKSGTVGVSFTARANQAVIDVVPKNVVAGL
jgi:hypothetical protein